MPVCYPLGGGQPGDTGVLRLADGTTLAIADTRKGEGRAILHVLEPDASPPPVGAAVHVELDWARRYCHMRMHTAPHLLEIAGVDLQPCGGTHVARTGEIGAMKLGKVEKKGRRNRGVNIVFDESQ